LTEALRVVLDTQIVLDLLHFADPRTASLRRSIGRGALRCFSDQPCFSEFERVVDYPQFALDAQARSNLVQRYRALLTFYDAPANESLALPRCGDHDDQKFLQLAVRCHADLLLTRDRHLLRLASDRRLLFAIIDGVTAGHRLCFERAWQ
jgi:putative PIN family toxin of toxin-antitoxin system